MNQYNIALIPTKKTTYFIELSSYFYEFAHTYQLGEHSFPHVTLCHFEATDDSTSELWEEVSKINIKPILLRFTHLRYKIYGDAKHGSSDLYWVSLIPEQKTLLMELHLQIAQIIQKPLNLAFDQYDPHLTLCNSLQKPNILWNNQIDDEFVLALGKSDTVGQLIKIIQIIK
ncbi:MAG TPA: 2'-5' RNA ligase family protein [Gammaproteobacteria bacterium]|nr:2'-5' RNA ligase family protein [Gammaproteobacteria bacterium]